MGFLKKAYDKAKSTVKKVTKETSKAVKDVDDGVSKTWREAKKAPDYFDGSYRRKKEREATDKFQREEKEFRERAAKEERQGNAEKEASENVSRARRKQRKKQASYRANSRQSDRKTVVTDKIGDNTNRRNLLGL